MIPFKNYVNITSGVGGGAAVALPALVGLIFSDNPLVPAGAVQTFNDAADVLTFYGASELANRAALYFSYLSPSISAPGQLKIAPMLTANIDAAIDGNTTPKSQAAFDAVANGGVIVTIGAHVATLTALNFTGLTLNACAALLQTAIRAVAGVFATATVTYNAVTNQFNATFPGTGGSVQALTVTAGTGTDISVLLGWTTAVGAVLTSASTGNNLLASFNAAVALDNNFGSFCTSLAAPVSIDDYVATAKLNATINNAYMFHINVKPANYAMFQAELSGVAGVSLTYELATLTQFPEMIPMATQAATNYYTANGTTGYMYRQIGGVTPSVVDGTLSATLDALRINYYGATQENGQNISFYQRGYLQGVGSAPSDMNTYSNEAWFKSYLGASILSLQLNLNKIGTGTIGRGQILTTMQSAIVDALENGTIETGKQLTNTQILYITQQTNDPNAWVQVQNSGYWKDCQIAPVVNNGVTEYNANYVIIYSKNDVVRKVNGSHQMI